MVREEGGEGKGEDSSAESMVTSTSSTVAILDESWSNSVLVWRKVGGGTWCTVDLS